VLGLAIVIALIVAGTGLTQIAQLWSTSAWLELALVTFLILLASVALYKSIQFARLRLAQTPHDNALMQAADAETEEEASAPTDSHEDEISESVAENASDDEHDNESGK
jgi:ABC-type nickel/cobalt efflux system permease component RcnA